jgi:multidrug resistance efflux pump
MKNFSLKRKASVIRTLKEPPQPKKGFNWQRWMWIAILCFVAFKIGHRVYKGVAKTQAEGQVEFGKQIVTFVHDIQLLHIKVKEGDRVQKGDTLFWYKNEVDPETNNNLTLKFEAPVEWIERERLHTEAKLSTKKIMLDALSQQLAMLHEAHQEQKELVLLGIHNKGERLLGLQQELASCTTNIKATEQEINFLKRYLRKLKKQDQQIRQLNRGQATQISLTQPYLAQTDGIIGQINFEPYEICYEQQQLLTIHQPETLSIMAYFDQEEIPYLKKGDIVDVHFPDGSLSRGVVNMFHISTYALPSEFQKKYEPTERNIVVDILPLQESEAEQWAKFYKMTVKLSKSRFQLLP